MLGKVFSYKPGDHLITLGYYKGQAEGRRVVVSSKAVERRRTGANNLPGIEVLRIRPTLKRKYEGGMRP